MNQKHLILFILFIFTLDCFGSSNNQNTENQGIDFSNQLVVLADSIMELWQNDPEKGVRLGQKSLHMPAGSYTETDKAYFDFVYGISYKNAGNRQQAMALLMQSLNAFERNKDWYYFHRVNEQVACMYREDGEYDRAIGMLTSSLDYYRSINNDKQINSVLINLGSAWLDKGRNNLALNAYLEAAKIDSVLGDTSTMALTKLGIGIVYQNLGLVFDAIDTEKAKMYYNQSLESIKESKKLFALINHRLGECYAQMNQASVYYNLKEFDQMEQILNHTQSCHQSADEKLVMELRILSAFSLYHRGFTHEALVILSEIAKRGEESTYPHIFHDAMLVMAELLYETNKTDSAIRLAESSTNWLRENGNHICSVKGTQLLAGWYKNEKNISKALEYQTKTIQCKDSLFKEASKELFDDLQLKYQNNSLKAELQQLETKKIIETRNLFITRLLLIILILSALVAILVIFLFFKKMNKKSTLLKQQLHESECAGRMKEEAFEKIRLENDLLEQKSNVQQLEVQLKQQEMMYQSIKQADLIQINKSIRERLNPFSIKIQKKKDQEDFEKLLDEISSSANMSSLNDFDSIFKQMHGDFYEKLLLNAPDLTPAELQMCALLRINLSSKEIARLMNLSKATIDLTRHYIRQKLNLDSSQNLTSYLIVL